MAKKTENKSISLESGIWDVLGDLVPSRSAFFNEQAKILIGADGTIEVLQKKIELKEMELQLLKTELEKKLKQKETSDQILGFDQDLIPEAIETCQRMAEANGAIGKNQIKSIAFAKELDEETLMHAVLIEGIKIIPHFEPAKETKKTMKEYF